MLEGSNDAKILFVSDFLRIQEKAEHTILAGDRRTILVNALQRAGILEDDYAFTIIHPEAPPGCIDSNRFSEAEKLAHFKQAAERINNHKANVIVPLGSYSLKFISGHDSIDKQHCSILPVKAEFGNRKCIALYHPEQVQKVYSLIAYISFGCLRLREEMHSHVIDIPQRKYLLSLDLTHKQQCDYLQDVVLKAAELSIDFETGNNVINTVGFAVSPYEAIALETHPYGKAIDAQHELWKLIVKALESDIPKIAQNALFEAQWCARYGIWLNNITHDTMWAMKFLHPELDKGLDNVGRIYTRFPYWKDDHSDWNNVRNWRQHLNYNCSDTTGTFAAKINQATALTNRKMDGLFYNYIMRFLPCIREMCSKGLLLDEPQLFAMRENAERDAQDFSEKLQEMFTSRLNRVVNIRSPKQVKAAFKDLGIKIPSVKGKESVDKKALVKLSRKYPAEFIFPFMLKLSGLNKQLSSYLNFTYDKDLHVRYSLDGVGTETGRWAGYTDPWGNGFNPQTVPKYIRNAFIAEPGKVLVQIDLKQAESRYVAYEAPEPKLMEMLENGDDIHNYVAAKIFNKASGLVTKQERQLGKKSGHSANYGVGPRTFAEACLVEMNIVLSEHEARKIIEGYYEVFPGIRKRQHNIQAEVRRTRMLKTPFGRERIFYDRMGDSLFREAYAYAPQSVIPDITNTLMLYLRDTFEDMDLLLQVHDSLLLQVESGRESEIAEAARDLVAWHPKISLPGGSLVIPVDVEAGYRWGKLKPI